MAESTLTGLRAGVLHSDEVQSLFKVAKAQSFALPAVNVTGTNTVNAVLETAKAVNSPVIIQFSNGGAQFFAGKSLPNDKQQASIAGAISGAQHVHLMAELYDVPVILHTDHAAKKLLPWIDGLLDAGEKYYAQHGQPLFSSHMLDLSEEPIEENIEICKRYLERMAKIGMTLEIELGVTGGEEDGVELRGLGPLGQLLVVRDVEDPVGLAVRVPPGRLVVTVGVDEQVEVQLPVRGHEAALSDAGSR